MSNAVQIRRELAKRRGTLFFTPADRALLALLEATPVFKEPKSLCEINADVKTGARDAHVRMLRTVVDLLSRKAGYGETL